MLDDEVKAEPTNGTEEDAKVADDMLGELESLMKDSKSSDSTKRR